MSEKLRPEVRKVLEGEVLPPLSEADRVQENYQKKMLLLQERAFSLMQESERLERQLAHQKRMTEPNDELTERTEDRLRSVQEDLADIQNQLEGIHREPQTLSGPDIIDGTVNPTNLVENQRKQEL
jgi:chromosome segregation ATPase